MWTIIALQETDEENEIHGLLKVTDVMSLYSCPCILFLSVSENNDYFQSTKWLKSSELFTENMTGGEGVIS